MVFLSYLITRLFTNKRHLTLEGDECRHLRTARNFYKMWNNQFYDFHPPLYSLLTRLFWSGRFVSFASSIGLYWVTYHLYRELGLSLFSLPTAFLFLTFNYVLIFYSQRIFRYQLFVFLFTWTILALLQHNWLLAGILGGLANLTCGFAGLKLLPLYLIFSPIPLFIHLIIYLVFWIKPKETAYLTNIYYPSGLEGKLEIVEPYDDKVLISPMYFPFISAYYSKWAFQKDWEHIPDKLASLFVPVGKKKSLIYIGTIIWGIAIAGMICYPSWLVIYTLFLVSNTIYMKYNPRNSIGAIPLLCYFIARGLEYLPHTPMVWLIFIFLAVYLWFNRIFILKVQQDTKVKVTSRTLQRLPEDGILSAGVIAYYIAFNTNKRVVILTETPDSKQAIYETDLAIDKFDLHYVVTSRTMDDIYPNSPALAYIKSFKLIKSITEDRDFYDIYEIER